MRERPQFGELGRVERSQVQARVDAQPNEQTNEEQFKSELPMYERLNDSDMNDLIGRWRALGVWRENRDYKRKREDIGRQERIEQQIRGLFATRTKKKN